MNTAPAIGLGRGLFDIFVPGVFLLLNVGGALCVLPFTQALLAWQPSGWIGSAAIGTVLGISFGYLLGVILRLLRVNAADRMSGWFLRRYTWLQWRRAGQPPMYLREAFPFIESLRIRCHRDFPPDAAAFFDKVWGEAKSGGGGQGFFNLCKLMVVSEDERMAAEIYTAEALTRYTASICYALAISWVTWGVAAVLLFVAVGVVPVLVLTLLGSYILAMAVIMRNLRFVRLKEVETLFAGTFKCRNVLFASRQR